ncbi:MAG: hypothetical protein K6E19_01010 [Lachnospiraceae bacterium]|nr:hypothetical protein [Lachnospiraceae bacterium]
MRKRIRVLTGIVSLMCLFILCISGCSPKTGGEKLSVAIPESAHVQDPENNYYIKWLEEQTGCELDITTIRQSNGSVFLDALFSSDAYVDIVMFGEDFKIDQEELSKYISSGDIYVNGDRTYYENTGSSKSDGVGQVFWINMRWLKALSLPIPETADDLKNVLKAFKEMDPNGNGIKDEIPMAGSYEEYSLSPVEFILNSYIYNDPYHSRFGLGENSNVLNAATDEFRAGIEYCHGLYEEGLLDDSIWDGNLKLLTELCNSDLDIIGAFTTSSISDVIYQGNPEILARYIHVPPLEGPNGERNALYMQKTPEIGAIITARSTRKALAKKLLSLMMTPEASLIARYGEEGVDWTYSDGSDVSVYGGVSTVTTLNYIWNTSQNKHLNGIGPMKVPDEYLEGVTWNGVNSDFEYINGRAYMSYEDHLPNVKEFHQYDAKLSGYIDTTLEAFIRGKKDIGSDEEWKRYLEGLSY